LDGYAIKQLADGDIKLVEEAIAKNYTTCQQYSHCYIMCGISGSGKSTWIANNLVDFEVISLDDIRAEINGKRSCQKSRGQVLQLAKQRFKKALAEKRNLVWDATNTRKDFREPLIELAINYGALVTLVVFQLSAKSLKQYNHNRTFSVSDDVQQNQLKKFEWPWQSQTHRQLVIGEAGQLLYQFGRF
jgi:predicted kinase